MSDKDSKRLYQSYYDKYKRNADAKRFYDSKAWKQVRQAALQRDNYTCQVCWSKGKYTAGNTVHHIIELLDDWSLALVLENLQTVCDSCHAEKHPEKLLKNKKEKKKKSFKVYKA